MNGCYHIFLGEENVGQAQVEKQGLYYRISCRCDLSGEVMCRVSVSCGGKQENLGLLVPESGSFVLSTRIPVSRLGVGEPEFRVLPRRPEKQGRFIPLSPQTPFAYLHRLENAYLEKRKGQLGIVLQD